METARQLTEQVVYNTKTLVRKPEEFILIGRGRSAYVFKNLVSNNAIKVFFPEFKHLANVETKIYRRLSGSPYFPEIYETGPNYIEMEFIEGYTFYDCLNKGIAVTDTMIEKVDEALAFARSKGLNPSDIHLRNLILTTQGNVKVIDVVRFAQDKQCHQWEDLKKAHRKYYQKRFFVKRLPKFFIDLIALYYKIVIVPFRRTKSP